MNYDRMSIESNSIYIYRYTNWLFTCTILPRVRAVLSRKWIFTTFWKLNIAHFFKKNFFHIEENLKCKIRVHDLYTLHCYFVGKICTFNLYQNSYGLKKKKKNTLCLMHRSPLRLRQALE